MHRVWGSFTKIRYKINSLSLLLLLLLFNIIIKNTPKLHQNRGQRRFAIKCYTFTVSRVTEIREESGETGRGKIGNGRGDSLLVGFWGWTSLSPSTPSACVEDKRRRAAKPLPES